MALSSYLLLTYRLYSGDTEEDASRLRTTALSLISEMGCDGYELPEALCNEMCRFGAAELHVVASFVGGIASQEVIKVRFIISLPAS